MGLFGKKNKREIINIEMQEEVVVKTSENESEPIIEVKPSLPLNEFYEQIIKNFNNIQQGNEKVTNEYYICRILSRVGLKDLDFNLQVLALDKNINRLKRECFDLKRHLSKIDREATNFADEIMMIDQQVNELSAFQIGLQNQLKEINNSSYGYLKISTVSVCLNKTNNELEILHNNIMEELKKFRSFNEAAEFIYYNSGDFIDALVTKIIACIKKVSNKDDFDTYNRHYFLTSDVVVTLEIKEWIDLYNKLKFVLRQLNNFDNPEIQTCKMTFNQFEAKYAILMMKTDAKNNRRF